MMTRDEVTQQHRAITCFFSGLSFVLCAFSKSCVRFYLPCLCCCVLCTPVFFMRVKRNVVLFIYTQTREWMCVHVCVVGKYWSPCTASVECRSVMASCCTASVPPGCIAGCALNACRKFAVARESCVVLLRRVCFFLSKVGFL